MRVALVGLVGEGRPQISTKVSLLTPLASLSVIRNQSVPALLTVSYRPAHQLPLCSKLKTKDSALLGDSLVKRRRSFLTMCGSI